jgi:hypothetical protein
MGGKTTPALGKADNISEAFLKLGLHESSKSAKEP